VEIIINQTRTLAILILVSKGLILEAPLQQSTNLMVLHLLDSMAKIIRLQEQLLHIIKQISSPMVRIHLSTNSMARVKVKLQVKHMDKGNLTANSHLIRPLMVVSSLMANHKANRRASTDNLNLSTLHNPSILHSLNHLTTVARNKTNTHHSSMALLNLLMRYTEDLRHNMVAKVNMDNRNLLLLINLCISNMPADKAGIQETVLREARNGKV